MLRLHRCSARFSSELWKNENQLTGFDFNWKSMPTFSSCQIEKRTLSASFCFPFILMLEQFPNITIQELTHSILILPRQTQLEFTLSLFLRLHCHQTYQLKTCWYSEKCNGRLLYNLDDDKILVISFQGCLASHSAAWCQCWPWTSWTRWWGRTWRTRRPRQSWSERRTRGCTWRICS